MVFHWVERGTFAHSTKWVQCPQEFITLYKGGHNSLDNKVPLQSSKGQLLLTIRRPTAFTRHCSQHRAVMEPKVRFVQKERLLLPPFVQKRHIKKNAGVSRVSGVDSPQTAMSISAE